MNWGRSVFTKARERVPQKLMDTKEREHVPVLLPEVLDLVAPQAGMRVIDATLGAGGYTRQFFERIGTSGQLLAFDWDHRAIRRFRESLPDDERWKTALSSGQLTLVANSFSALDEVLREKGWDGVDGIVADLGLSSLQLDDPERGLSFQVDGPLDMRLNSDETVTAADIVNGWSEEALAELFQIYADEGEAARIARAITLERRPAPITRTKVLAELVKKNVVGARRRGRIHPATKVFQALRMAVNSEMQHLNAFLEKAFTALKPGGRLAIVSFHSGEDGLVKRSFQNWVRLGLGKPLTKKPIVPGDEERERNPRARSAKLRGIQKL